MTRKGALLRNTTLAFALGSGALGFGTAASAQIEPYLGQMIQVGFNFCPSGWATASGQILSISQNTALFSLLGTTYGGNGQTTFALPDMRGRAAVHVGQGPGLSVYELGQVSGAETVTLTVNELAKHDHRAAIQTANANANATTAAGNAIGISSNNSYITQDPVGNLMDRPMVAVQPTGNSIPVNNRPPYLVMNWCIAVQGLFPSRN